MHTPSDDIAPTLLKSWLAVLSVALGAFVVVTSEFLPIGLLTHISGGLHISPGIAGLMVTIPGLVAAAAAPIMTIGAGHIDRRTLVLGLLSLLVVSNVTAALAPNFAVMLVARIFFGITLGGFWTIAVTLGGRLVPRSSMARATTVILAGISIATVAGVPVGTLIASLVGWRWAFAAFGGVALLAGVIQLFVLPSLPPPPAAGWRQFTALLGHADARLGLFTIAVVISGHFAAYTYIAPFLKDRVGIDAHHLSTLLLAFGVAGIAGNFLGGGLAANHLRTTLIGVVTLLGCSVTLLPFFPAHQTFIAALIVLWGLAFGAIPITLQLWVFKAAPEALEGGAALLVTTFQIFIALGSVLGGRIVDSLGTPAVMWAGGGTALLGLLLIVLAKPVPRRSAAVGAAEFVH